MRFLFSTLALAASLPVAAGEFTLPPEGSDVIGETITTQTETEDTLLDLARRYGLGYEEITNANPGVDPWLPGAGTVVVVPKQRLLPRAPRTGVVINLPEHRLYYFAPAKAGAAACRVDLPGQHRKDGLEHAARQDDDRLQGQGCRPGCRRNRCARSMRSAASILPAGRSGGTGQSDGAVRDARSAFPAAPT